MFLSLKQNNMAIVNKKLVWEDKYSVGVKLIDDQHKKMFAVINELVEIIASTPTKEQVSHIIESLVQYKKFHFITEEKYFKEFNYEEAEEHIAKHHEFSERLETIQKKFGDDTLGLAFALVDFLEDWLIEHLLVVDHRYVKCFSEHGLK